MAQFVKCLLFKHGDLSKKPGVVAHTCNAIVGGGVEIRFLGLPGLSEEMRWSACAEQYLKLTSHPCRHMHMCTHTHMHIHMHA